MSESDEPNHHSEETEESASLGRAFRLHDHLEEIEEMHRSIQRLTRNLQVSGTGRGGPRQGRRAAGRTHISTEPLTAAERQLQRVVQRVTGPAGPSEFEQEIASATRRQRSRWGASATENRATPTPAVTITSALTPTMYKDQNDTTTKSLDYIKAQRKVLTYLETRAADSLTARLAATWTQDINPRTKRPDAQEALSLCYYMRSQGYDVYAKFEDHFVKLYVVNQKSPFRHKYIDSLYWAQNIKTHAVRFADTDLYPTSRRSAMANIPVRGARPPTSAPAGSSTVGEGAFSEESVTAQVADPIARAEIERVRARLDAELQRDDPNPEVIAAAIQELEALLPQHSQTQD